MRIIVWTLIALLVIAHQDFFLWNDTRLLFGFLPIGLAWHIGLSIAAGLVWLLAVQFAWPQDLVEQVVAVTEEPPAGSAPQGEARNEEAR